MADMDDKEHDSLLDGETAADEDNDDEGSSKRKKSKIDRFAPQTSDHERDKRQRRIFIALALVGALGVGWSLWRYMSTTAAPRIVVSKLPPTQNTFMTPPAPKVRKKIQQSHLSIDPPGAIFGNLIAGKDTETTALTLTAVDGPVHISEITLPFAENSGIDMRADSCLNRDLQEGAKCTITLRYAPLHSDVLGNEILIKGLTYEVGGTTNGKSRPLSAIIDVKGRATVPPPPPPAPIVLPKEDHTAERQNEYLARREHPNLEQQAGGLEWHRAAQPDNADWRVLGFAKSVSSYPVDMSRVITMDKAIPAVIKVPIDTRESSRAVATVERDIYGGDGRTVLIERGSTLVGIVQAIGDSSEEKVGIAWLRLVRPDGVAFSFQASSGDAMGRAGVLAHIDNRWFERFGKAALFSLVEGGITLAINPSTTSTNSNGTAISGISGSITTGGTTTTAQNAQAIANEEIQGNLLPLYQEYAREQMSLPVIRTVPAGTRITVWPATDLWVRPIDQDHLVATPVRRSAAPAKAYNLNLPTQVPAALTTAAAQKPAQPALQPSYQAVYPDALPGSAPPPAGLVQPSITPVNTAVPVITGSQISRNVVTHNAQPQATAPAAQIITPSGAPVAAPPWAAQTK